MHVLTGRNVNNLFDSAVHYISVAGNPEDTRGGKVLAVSHPVMSVYRRPRERMLFSATRDANPYFHVIEAMWMLTGSAGVHHLTPYNARMEEFSDDGVTLPASYGYRWTEHFEVDQIKWVVDHLKNNPNSRRAVIAMWDPFSDPRRINSGTKDVPCNTHIYFAVRDRCLDMTVCCRSNDIVWGAYGANAVHFSVLQQFIAEQLGLLQGIMYQLSNNWHMYERHFGLIQNSGLDESIEYGVDVYAPEARLITGTTADNLIADLIEFFETPTSSFRGSTWYVNQVLVPLRRSWEFWKVRDFQAAEIAARSIVEADVSMACVEWLQRRNAK